MPDNHVTKIFKTDFLLDMGLPYDAPTGGKIISKEIVETTRWSIVYALIVHFPDQPDCEAWEFVYSEGATECQDEKPWEYEDEVEATLVREKEVLVRKWLPVDEAS